MLALKFARDALAASTLPAVILSAADRLLPLPEIGPLLFPLGTRSRRISHSSQRAAARLLRNSRGVRTYTNREPNTFKMSTSEIHDFKSRKMSTSEKTPRGWVQFPGVEVPSGTTQISPGPKPWGACVLPISEAPQGATQGCAASRATKRAILVPRNNQHLHQARTQAAQNEHFRKTPREGGLTPF
jgi:hypothetical protein